METQSTLIFRLTLPDDAERDGRTLPSVVELEGDGYRLQLPAGWPLSRAHGHPDLDDGDIVADLEGWFLCRPGTWSASERLEGPFYGAPGDLWDAVRRDLSGHALLIVDDAYGLPVRRIARP
ncbi:MAG: hypothetical protein JSV86_07355 [Gemmatimonadota bacterium]|nr:MAG: hypothetical protein JSV86_07355 [Gemmatimonadota bacterium]